MARIKRDDTILVIAGKNRNQRGKVLSVLPKDDRVVVQGVNIIKRHMRQRPGTLQTGIIEREAPISLSNVMLVCPRCDKPARVAHQVVQHGDKVRRVRVCKKCGEVMDQES